MVVSWVEITLHKIIAGNLLYSLGLHDMGTAIRLGTDVIFLLQPSLFDGSLMGTASTGICATYCHGKVVSIRKFVYIVSNFLKLSREVFFLIAQPLFFQAFYFDIICFILDIVNVGVFFPSRSGIYRNTRPYRILKDILRLACKRSCVITMISNF